MKQFVVVKIGDLLDMRTPQWRGDDNGRFAYWQYQAESTMGSDLPRDHQVYFTDTLEAAQHMAKRLAEVNVGCRYMACEGNFLFECRAAPVIASKWSKAGLLPA